MCSEVCCDVAHLSGFEPKAFRLGGGRSILLSYRCTKQPLCTKYFTID